MEVITYQDPFEYDIVWPISSIDRQNTSFAEAERLVDNVFRELGAKVVYGVADAGEPPAPPELIIPEPQSEAMAVFHGRPA